MKKHLLFSLDYLPNTGGIARMMSSIRNEFVTKGENMDVLTAFLDVQIKEDTITRIRGRRFILELKCWWYLMKHSHSLILCARWYPEGLLALLASKKYVVFTHAAELLPLKKNTFINKLRESIKSKVLKNAKNVIANSRFTRGLYSGHNSIEIPLAVNPKLFHPTDKQEAKNKWNFDNKKILLTVSRIQDHKGHELVFKAIKSLPSSIKKEIIYLIAGTGTYTSILINLVKDYKLEKNVKFLGFIPEQGLLSLLNASDIFLLCSTSEIDKRKVEGFGLSLLEAQACGIPVIGNNSGGIPSAIQHEYGGFVIDANNTKEFSTLLIKLLDDSEFYIEQSNRARNAVENYYNWSRYYNELNEVLN